MNTIHNQLSDLPNLSHDELKQLWRQLFGKPPPAYSRPYLIKRLAYRIQEIHYGGLSENLHATMRETLRTSEFDQNAVKISSAHKKHQFTPLLGTRFVRKWHGNRYEVTVIPGGFEYQGQRYRSLTAVAKAITGTHYNGRTFFGLYKKEK
ncbi:MAG: DUF2924 domain-containing protein [Armatimonadota bacterium]|nr:DUF2924 domain-containing protein [bacterium]